MTPRILEDWLDGYVAYTDNTEPPELYKLWAGIFCIAAVLKRKCYLPWGMFTTYPNLYVVLVGPSGLGKGVAMMPAVDMLRQLSITMAADAGSKEALTRALARSASDTDVMVDGKIEIHSSLSIVSTEFCVFLGYKNMDLIGYLCKWYDCETKFEFDAKDKTKADTVNNLWVSLFGGTTPHMVQTHMPMDTVGLGLTSRIIFVFEQKPSKACPIPFLTEEQEEMKWKLIKDLEQIHMLKGPFKYTPGFMAIYIDWYMQQREHPPFDDERLGGYARRRSIHMLKLSMIMCASRTWDMQITQRDFDRALHYLTLTEVKMPQVFAGMGKNPLSTVMHRAMHLVGMMGSIGYGELFSMLSDDVDARDFEVIVKALELNGFAHLLIEGKRKTIVKN